MAEKTDEENTMPREERRGETEGRDGEERRRGETERSGETEGRGETERRGEERRGGSLLSFPENVPCRPNSKKNQHKQTERTETNIYL